jgi:hypothetical protein
MAQIRTRGDNNMKRWIALALVGGAVAVSVSGCATLASGDGTTGPHSFGTEWNNFVANWAKPLAGPGLVALCILVGLFILARLLVYAPKTTPDWLQDQRRRRWVGLGAVVVIVLATIGVTWGLAELWFGVVVLFGLIALAGAVVFAAFLATRLSVFVDVQKANKTDTATNARLVALVNDLGATPSKGIEFPLGSDVTALKDASLSVPSTNAFVSALQWIANSLFTTTPWHVQVGTGDTDGADVSVVITRNRRFRGAFVISADLLLPPATTGAEYADETVRRREPDTTEPKADAANPLAPYLFEFAAAAIVVTLSKSHAGFDGLCGATDWRSVGLQYLATTRFRRDPLQVRMLLRAVELDPDNLPAAVALHFALHRHASSPGELSAYLNWLDSRILKIEDTARAQNPPVTPSRAPASPGSETLSDTRPPTEFPGETIRPSEDLGWAETLPALDGLGEPLEVETPANQPEPDQHPTISPGMFAIYCRLLASSMATALNLRAIGAFNDDDRLRTVGRRLLELLTDRSADAAPLVRQLRPNAVLWYATVLPIPLDAPFDNWLMAAEQLDSPVTALNAACYYLERSDETLSDAETQVIADRLSVAVLDPDIAAQVGEDPVLRKYAGESWFIAAVTPRPN